MNRADYSPGEVIRAAAHVLRREAAEAERVLPSPWNISDDHTLRSSGPQELIVVDRSCDPDKVEEMPYIAMMQPRAGVALCDLLDKVGDAYENHKDGEAGEVAAICHVALELAWQILSSEARREASADALEKQKARSEGGHASRGATCEECFPSDSLRNGIMVGATLGSKAMLDELLRHARLSRDPVTPPGVTVHSVPVYGTDGLTGCCRRIPHELLPDRLSRNTEDVNCPGPPKAD